MHPFLVEIPHRTAEDILVIGGVINSALLLIITAYHIHSVNKNMKSLNPFDSKTPLNLSIFLTFPLLFFAFVIAITQPLLLIGTHCAYSSIYIGAPCYYLFKLTLYLILICRVHEAFKGSGLGYSPFKLKVWAGLLIVCESGMGIAHQILTTTYIDHNTFPKCLVVVHDILIISVVGVDFIAFVVNLWLFIWPLCQMDKIVDDNDDSFKEMAKKQCRLSIIAVVTTILVYPGAGIFPQLIAFLGMCDINISILCIILS